MGPFSVVKLSAKSLVEFDMASQLEFDISEKDLRIFPSIFLFLMYCLLFCVMVKHLWTNGKALLLIFDFFGYNNIDFDFEFFEVESQAQCAISREKVLYCILRKKYIRERSI